MRDYQDRVTELADGLVKDGLQSSVAYSYPSDRTRGFAAGDVMRADLVSAVRPDELSMFCVRA